MLRPAVETALEVIVGDGAVICYIQDLIVTPECHGRGIGTQMIEKLRDFVISLKDTP